jgi:hypothetical protein
VRTAATSNECSTLRAAKTRTHGRFDVLWPTVLARDVVRGAVAHAERRAAAAPSGDSIQAASDALAAAERTLRDYEAVDNGGLLDVWL